MHHRSRKKMPPCDAGVCAPIGSPVPEPAADSPLTSPPADALPPDSSPIASEPPPADTPQPIFHQSTSPPPPVLEWKSSSANSVASPVINTFSKSSSLPMAVIAGAVVVGAILLLVLGIFLICCCCRKKKKRDQISPNVPPAKDGSNGGQRQYRQPGNPPSSEDHRVSNLPPPPGAGFRPSNPSSRSSSLPPDTITSGNSGPSYNGAFSCSKSAFSYEELAKATNGFSDANFLGQGGFGSVHKGTLEDGREVAIKSLKADSGQGEREFQAEIDVISRVHHKHLVTLVGFCITGSHRMLVYEFVANKTLEFHLYAKGRPTMDWPTRLKIALGAAKGLAYLHEDCHPKIIHRDIKGANILLDSQFETKVADFGLAKITEDANTHVSTRVMGTFGYLAPEYASSGKLTEKSDVFSFGVMLLELITGRRPVDRKRTYMDDSLVEWAKPLLAKAMEDGNFEPFVDPKLQNNYSHDEMARMVACAAGATSHSARRRPKMSQIVRALDSSTSLSDINSLMAPGESRAFGAYGSDEYSSGQYKEDMKRFRMMVLQTQDSASNGYTTGTTEEYSFMQSESTNGIQDNQSLSISIAK